MTLFIPFNLGMAINGYDPSYYHLLQINGVGVFLSQNGSAILQKRQNSFVFAEREVTALGKYQALQGENLAQIARRVS